MDNRLRRLFLYSLSRPLSLTAIFLLIVGSGFGFLVLGPSIPILALWASFCGGLLAATMIATVCDPEKRRDAILASLDPVGIHDSILRAKVGRGIEYVRSAREVIGEAKAGQLASVVADLPALEAAARGIFLVSRRIDRYRQDQILRKDLVSLKWRNGSLTESQQRYLATLIELERLMKEAAQQIDNVLAEMGWSYASMQAILVKPEFLGGVASSFGRVRAMTRRLEDISSSFDEVYDHRLPTPK